VTVADPLISNIKVLAALAWLKQNRLGRPLEGAAHSTSQGSKPNHRPHLEGAQYKYLTGC